MNFMNAEIINYKYLKSVNILLLRLITPITVFAIIAVSNPSRAVMIASSIIIFHIRIPYAEAAERMAPGYRRKQSWMRDDRPVSSPLVTRTRYSREKSISRLRIVPPQGRLQVDIEREPQSPFCAISDSL